MSIKKIQIIRWAFDLTQWKPQMKELLIATSCIQAEEKERLSKFVFRDDFEASIIGRLLMRKFINKITKLPYNKIKFNRDDRGKPYFPNELNDTLHCTDDGMYYYIDFNVSHQGSYSVLAGYAAEYVKNYNENNPIEKNIPTKKTTIGVDIMKIEYTGGKSTNEFFRIMTRNFSNDEWKCIRSAGNDDSNNKELKQIESFMRHWCLKESYVKNIGVGITIDLQKINFKIHDKQLSYEKPIISTQLTVNDNLQFDWLFEESQLNENHFVAIAIQNPPTTNDYTPKPFEFINFDKLIENYIPLLEPDQMYCEQILNKEYK